MAEMNTQAGGDGKKTRMPSWRSVLLGAGIVVFAAGAGMGLRWWQNKPETSGGPKPLPAAIEESQNQALDGNYENAHKTIDTALSGDNLSDQQKYELYVQQGATYSNEGKYKEAIESYKKAAAIKETQNVYTLMAEDSAELGDKQAAINYYKKAIENIAESNPIGQANKKTYELRIQELENPGSTE